MSLGAHDYLTAPTPHSYPAKPRGERRVALDRRMVNDDSNTLTRRVVNQLGRRSSDDGQWFKNPHVEQAVPVRASTAPAKKHTVLDPHHYQSYPIEPIAFIVANNIPYREANALKYIMRHRMKNGREDIEKAIRYLERILETDYAK